MRIFLNRPVLMAFMLGLCLQHSIAGAAEPEELNVQAIKILHPHANGGQIDKDLSLIGKASFQPWHEDSYLLALAERSDKDNQAGFNIELGIFVPHKDKLSLIAHCVIDSPDLVVEQGYLSGVTVDPAAYKINDRETAFGIRVMSAYDAANTHVAGESLYLIRPPTQNSPDEMAPIFNAQTDQYDPSDTASARHPATVAVLLHKTNGFYDLQVKGDKKGTIFLWNEASNYYENPEADQSY